MIYKFWYIILNDEGAIYGIEAKKLEIIKLALRKNHILNIFGPFFSVYGFSQTIFGIHKEVEDKKLEDDISSIRNYLLNDFFKFHICFVDKKLVISFGYDIYNEKHILSSMTFSTAQYFTTVI